MEFNDSIAFSDSDTQPFHSTPKKKAVSHGITAGSSSKSNSHANTFEPLSESNENATLSSKDGDTNSGESVELGATVQNQSFDMFRLNGADLSYWEKWLIRKEKERREYVLEKIKLNKLKELESIQLEEIKRVRLHLADITRKLWVKNKNKEVKEQQKLKEQKEILEKTRKEKEKEYLHNLSLEKYKVWKEKKEQVEQEKKQEEEMKRMISLEEKLERLELNKSAFQAWLKRASKRPLPKHFTYGYTGGLLVGYHDGTSPPEPSFCNPVPWNSSTDYCDSLAQ